ncbi:MAG: tetratricopeptide repeat protein [Methyloceanibacter sp.]
METAGLFGASLFRGFPGTLANTQEKNLRRLDRRWPHRAILVAGFLLAAGLAANVPLSAHAATTSQREQALRDTRQASASLLRGSYEEADTLLEGALKFGGLDYLEKAAALKNRGVARWCLGRLRAAMDDFNAAVTITPDDPALYNNRGNVLVSLGINEEAIKDFDHSILLFPRYVEAFNNRGNAHFQAGDYLTAFRDFSRAIELRPDDAVPFNGRGKVQLLLGRRFGALRDLRRATTLNAGYAIARVNRAKALVTLQRYEEAIEEYNLAIRLNPKSATSYLDRARAHARLGKPDAALEDMTAAIKLDPSLATAFAERSAVYSAMGKDEEATADLREALSLDSGSTAALAQVARFLLQAGAPAAALPTIEEALKADPESAVALQVRGEIQEALGQPKLALSDYHQALHFEPFQPESLEGLTRIAEASGAKAKKVGPTVGGWTLRRSAANHYVAENPDYRDFRIALEMYGQGEPRLLNWKPQKGSLWGTGTLTYYAGTAADGRQLEYAALIDFQTRKLVAIEPVRWGDREAEWSWNNLDVVVTDPQGVPNRLELRGAPTPSKVSAAGATSRARLGRAQRPVVPASGGFSMWPF